MIANQVGEVVLQQDGILNNVPGFLQNALSEFVAFLPRLVGAIVILIIGWIVGALVGKLVRRVADGVGLDSRARDTPLGRLGKSEDPVSNLLGTIAAWFIYALAILAAADALAIPVLSRWIATAVSYLPAFIAGLIVIIGGFVVADFLSDTIRSTGSAVDGEYTAWFATGARLFLYFMAITIGLQTMGVQVGILYVFAEAAAWGTAAAIAIGAGIAIGWGGHTYVSENIDRWMGQAKRAAPSPNQSGGSNRSAESAGADD